MLQNLGAGATLRIRVKLGATTLWDSGTQTLSNKAGTRVGWAILFRIANLGATNSQQLGGHIVIGGAGPNASVTGWGTFTTQTPEAGGFGGTSAEDTTASKTLVVTAQWGTSSALLSTRLQGAHIVVNNKAA
jgi:hypothetical protein